MTESLEAAVSVWEQMDPTTFLTEDATNPARALAAEIIKGHTPCTMIEVGPGTGIDYELHFSRMSGLDYHGIEACKRFVERLVALHGNHFSAGTFASLKYRSADVLYTKATLEHQPGFKFGLGQMFNAARRAVVINWYRPLMNKGPAKISFSEGDQLHYNQYVLSDVRALATAMGWKLIKNVMTGGPVNTPQTPINNVTVFVRK